MCFRPAAVSMDKTCPQCGAELPASALPAPNVGAPGAPGVPSAPGSPKAPGAPKAPGSN